MGIVFDESTAFAGVKFEVDDKTNVVEEGYEVRQVGEVGYITQINRGLPIWSLAQNHFK